MDETKQPGLIISQIFLDHVHFEHGRNVLAYPPTTSVQVKTTVELSVAHPQGDDSKALINVTVTTIEDESALYRFRLQMVALVLKDETAPNLPPTEYLKSNGMALLFSFVREAVANITGRGRFGPIWLRPMNLMALEPGTPLLTTEPLVQQGQRGQESRG